MHRNKTHIHLHTICTQYAHTQHREQNTRYNNMQHRTQNNMQHINNTEQNTENNNTEQDNAQDNAQPQQNSAHNYRTYSLDYYKEYVAIKNSNTIELYNISKENIQKTLISSLYSFDFYDEYAYIKKLYNTDICKTYTFCSPY